MSSINRIIAMIFGSVLHFAFIGSYVLAQNFDEPIRKQIVDYGLADPNESSSQHIKLSCFYYHRFMVKQYDKGELGSEWLAISPISKGTLPKCSRIHDAQEKVIKKWIGYFKGTKGDYVFFNAEDAFNRGYPFAVFDAATGKKLFEDSSLLNDRRDTLQTFEASDGKIILRYTRVFLGNCSIPKDKDVCWERIRKENGLPQSPIPKCSGYDDESLNSLTPAYLDNPSVIGYPVEVMLSATPAIKILPGLVTCWGGD